jgi:hypothetical protein
MATESISQRCDAIDDPATQRAMIAIFNSLNADIQTLKAIHNAHIHVAAGALGTGTTPATTTTPSGQVGNLNTTA